MKPPNTRTSPTTASSVVSAWILFTVLSLMATTCSIPANSTAVGA